MTVLDAGQQSLLRAAQNLQSAAGVAAATPGQTDPARHEIEFSVHVLLWLAASLLPDGLPLVPHEPVRTATVVDLLSDAERELRHLPITSYPQGTVDVVVGLCDLIRDMSGEQS